MDDGEPVAYFTGPPYNFAIISATKEKWASLLFVLANADIKLDSNQIKGLESWMDTLQFSIEE